MPIADALAQTHKELEQRGKGAIARASVKCAEANEALPLPDAQSLSQLANALGRVFQWSNGKGKTVTIHADKAVIVVDEARRSELIEQRRRLLEAEKPATGRTVEVAAPATLPKQQAQSSEAGARNSTVAQDQEPTVQQDPFYRHMEAIGKGESLRTGKGSEQCNEPSVVTDYMPWPEELQ
jgi:predicted secreted protein